MRLSKWMIAGVCRFLLAAFLLHAGHVLAGEAPMVAYLYSTYRPGNDKGMHDQILSQLGWSHHKWENVDVA
ncbi:MAG: hypothetical protein V2A58_01770, partial [Planctomycetota bacterium]